MSCVLCYVNDGQSRSWICPSPVGTVRLSENKGEVAEFPDVGTANAFISARPFGTLQIVQLTNQTQGGHDYGHKSHN